MDLSQLVRVQIRSSKLPIIACLPSLAIVLQTPICPPWPFLVKCCLVSFEKYFSKDHFYGHGPPQFLSGGSGASFIKKGRGRGIWIGKGGRVSWWGRFPVSLGHPSPTWQQGLPMQRICTFFWPQPHKTFPDRFPCIRLSHWVAQNGFNQMARRESVESPGKSLLEAEPFFPQSLNHLAAFSPQTFQGPFNGLMLSWSSNIWYLSPGFGEI